MDWFSAIVVGLIMVIATITDVRTLKVHNWLTIPAFVTGVVYHATTGGTQGFTVALFNGLAVFALLMILYLLGAVGAGDVKLVAAIATWLGTSMVFSITAIGLFATGIYSLFLLMRQRRLQFAWVTFKLSMLRLQMVSRHLGGQETVHEISKSPDARTRLVPFSAMLAVGVMVQLAWCIWSA